MKLYANVYRYENEDSINYTFSLRKAKEWKGDAGNEGEITAMSMTELLVNEREVEVYENGEHSQIGKIELIELLAELYKV